MYNKGLFHTWVPKGIQLLLILIFTVVILCTNSIYSGNINDMVSSLGSLAELITMANNASTIGMMVVFPLLLRTKSYFRTKELLIVSLLLLTFLSIVCATTDNAYLIILCSFFIGFFKMFGMIEVIIPVMFILSPTGDRGKFYSIFYPFSIVLGQISGYYTTILAAQFHWQYSYLFMSIGLLGATLLAIVFMHNLRGGKKVPLYYFDWLSLAVLSVSLMCLNYVLVFGRQQEWFESATIKIAFITFIITLFIFIKRQFILKRPYLKLSVLKKKNVYNSMILISLMGLYLASGSIQSAFTNSVLKYDAATNASLNLLMIPGILLGGIIANIWFRKKWWLKSLIFMGFLAYHIYAMYMYFLLSPIIDIELLIFPSILKGFGMSVLFISIGFYCADKLQMVDMLSSSAVLIVFRSFIGTAVFGAIFSWGLYQLQWQYVSNFGSQMDYTQTVGISTASANRFGTVQVQATLAAAKEMFGYIILMGWGILLYVLLHRFIPIHLRRMILFRKKLRYRESIKDYRISGD
jgi:DHA2 family multidrug resistance protein